MAQQLVNIGATANDGTGDTFRNAFDKLNDNDTELYAFKGNFYSVKDYGAIGDNVNDDHDAIQSAIDAASAAGGGEVLLPKGTYLVGNKLTLKSNIILVGQGVRNTIIRLANGVNKTVIEGENYLTLSGGTSSSGVTGYGIRNLTVNGNRDNNASAPANEGHGIAIYGHQFLIENVKIIQTQRRGLTVEFAGSSLDSEGYNGRGHKITVYKAGEHGIYSRVSDSHWDDINISAAGCSAVSTFDGFFCDSNVRLSNVNLWSSEGTNFMRYGINMDGNGNTVANIHTEAGALANVYVNGLHNSILGNFSYNARGILNILISGNFNTVSTTFTPGFWAGTRGIQVGEVGSAAAYNIIHLTASSLSDGFFDFVNSGGGNVITATVFNSSVINPITGTVSSRDILNVYGSTGSALFSYLKNATQQVAAAGSTSGTATVLNQNIVTVTTSGANQGVRLSGNMTVSGTYYEITNASTNALNVYPHSLGNFQGLSADVAISVAAGVTARIVRATTGGWSRVG